jgi:hypothetical protein
MNYTLLDADEYGVETTYEETEAEETETEEPAVEASENEPEVETVVDMDIIDDVEDLPEDVRNTFRGLDVRVLNHSTSNPLASLSRIALDASAALDERKQAFRYMYQSAYIDKQTVCMHVLLSVLGDDTLSLEQRFEWLRTIPLAADGLEVALHGYVYWFYTHAEPLTFHMLAAQFVLAHPIQSYPMIRSHVKHAQNALYRIATQPNAVNVRSEAADMLLRLGTEKFRAAGERVIHELGHAYVDARQRTVYTNAQNAHDVQNVQAVLDALVMDTDTSLDDVFTFLQPHEHALESFQRIVLDTATYGGYALTDVFRSVYRRIVDSPHRAQLEQRLIEELTDMNGWCSTGHLVRLLNVFQGFGDVALTIDPRQEVRAAVFARLQYAMRKSCSPELQEELMLAFCSADKTLLEEFVEVYGPYEELKQEYPDAAEFDQWYADSIKAYLG